MNKIEEALWRDYDTINESIQTLERGSDDYKDAVQERDNIRNELLKLEQIDKETKAKVSQIESENKRDKIRNIITLATFGVNVVLVIWGTRKTFKFDEVATVTSTGGRKILDNVLPKLWKR